MSWVAKQSTIFQQFYLLDSVSLHFLDSILITYNSINHFDPNLARNVIIWLHFLSPLRHYSSNSTLTHGSHGSHASNYIKVHLRCDNNNNTNDSRNNSYSSQCCILWSKYINISFLLFILTNHYANDNFYDFESEGSDSNAYMLQKPTCLVNGRIYNNNDNDNNTPCIPQLWNDNIYITILTSNSTVNMDNKISFLDTNNQDWYENNSDSYTFMTAVTDAINSIDDIVDRENVLAVNNIGDSNSKLIVDHRGQDIGLFKDGNSDSPFSYLDVCYNYQKDSLYRSLAAYYVIKVLNQQCGFKIKTPEIYPVRVCLPCKNDQVSFEEIIGSVQVFIDNCEHCEREAGFGVSTRLFEEIAVFDMLIGNFDSSEENLLLKRRKKSDMSDEVSNNNNNNNNHLDNTDVCDVFDMYSIDHDYTFPDDIGSLYQSEWFWTSCIFARKQFNNNIVNGDDCMLGKLDIIKILKDLYCIYGISESSLLIMFVIFNLLLYLNKSTCYNTTTTTTTNNNNNNILSIADIGNIIRNCYKGKNELKLVCKAIIGIKQLNGYEHIWSLENVRIHSNAINIVKSVIDVYLV